MEMSVCNVKGSLKLHNSYTFVAGKKKKYAQK